MLAGRASEVVSSAISSSDYLRGGRLLGRAQQPPHKEWFHFSVNDDADDRDLVVNYSLLEEPTTEGPDRPIARVILLVREGATWRGGLVEAGDGEVTARRGKLSLSLGAGSMQFKDGRFVVSARLPNGALSVDLELVPLTVPGVFNNLPLGPEGRLSWVFVPRLHARGTAIVDGRRLEIRDATAYHDHNWGHFTWGGNFAWEWGYAVAPLAEPWSLVLSRLSDRGHHADLSRALFLWDGMRQRRFFRNEEITVEHEGFLRPRRPLRIPGIMRMLAPGDACDVPRRVILRAASGRDRLTCVYDAASVAQIGVPHDGDRGATIINEATGMMDVEGRIGGRAVAWRGRALFEFLDG